LERFFASTAEVLSTLGSAEYAAFCIENKNPRPKKTRTTNRILCGRKAKERNVMIKNIN
jgi:hypothetical protein